MDFWTCPDPPKPTIFIFGDTRTPKENQEIPWNIFENDLFVNMGIMFSIVCESPMYRVRFCFVVVVFLSSIFFFFINLCEDVDREMMKIG